MTFQQTNDQIKENQQKCFRRDGRKEQTQKKALGRSVRKKQMIKDDVGRARIKIEMIKKIEIMVIEVFGLSLQRKIHR